MLRQRTKRWMRWGIAASICLGLGVGTAAAQTDDLEDAMAERLADEESADGDAFPDLPSDVPPPLPIDELESMVIDAGPLLVHFWDPLLIHSQVYYRHRFQIDYAQRMQQWHTYYVKREDERPRRTVQEQIKLAAVTQSSVAVQQSLMVASLDDMARKRPSGPDRLTTISLDTRKTLLTDARGLHELTQQRSRMESLGELAAKPGIRKLPSEAGKPSSGRPKLLRESRPVPNDPDARAHLRRGASPLRKAGESCGLFL